jgi:hypothetical protein
LIEYGVENKVITRDQAIKELDKMLPFGPKLSLSLISNRNIDDYCSLLEKKHPNYMHIGTMMIDFYMIKLMRSVDLTEIVNIIKDNKVSHYSLVINTDRRSGSGEHWFVVLFVKKDEKFIQAEIFDS